MKCVKVNDEKVAKNKVKKKILIYSKTQQKKHNNKIVPMLYECL